MKNDIEVAPDGDEWVLQEHGGEEIGRYDTSWEAERDGRALADQRDVELFIKNEEGQIRDRDSHGNDPPETEG